MADLTELVDRWRQEIAVLQRWGAERQATVLQTCLKDVEEWHREQQLRELTIKEAAEVSGFSRSALEKMGKRGELTPVGSPGHPRYIAGELPRKARRRQLRIMNGEPDLAGEVLTGRSGW